MKQKSIFIILATALAGFLGGKYINQRYNTGHADKAGGLLGLLAGLFIANRKK